MGHRHARQAARPVGARRSAAGCTSDTGECRVPLLSLLGAR
jgi:hypothetical protein